MKKILFTSIFLLFLFFSTSNTFAESSYVLPYPGVMPGNKFYNVSEFVDLLKGLYAIGDFAQFKYSLAQSDKYLVEAKTLFEYSQFPLALNALGKSNMFFEKVGPNLKSAKLSGKDISEKTAIFENASQKHIEVLQKLKEEVPESFIWAAENKQPVNLSLWQALNNAIDLRKRQ